MAGKAVGKIIGLTLTQLECFKLFIEMNDIGVLNP